jgi:hypothetical protein
MAKADYIGLKGNELLAKAFAGWSFNGFDFPKADVADGCTGEKCISRAVQFFLRRPAQNGSWHASPDDVIGLISGHLYFKASCGEIKQSTVSVKLALKEFHLTVRRTKGQLLIDDAGSSILTSEESIHINRNTDWGRDANINNLVRALANDLQGVPPFTRAEVLAFLKEYRKYTTEHMAVLADELKVEAPKHLAAQVGVTVTVEPDASITGR